MERKRLQRRILALWYVDRPTEKDIWTGSLEIHIFPQLIAAAIKRKEDDLYLLWLCCKAVDSAIDASGCIKKSNMLGCARFLYGISTTQLYEKLKKGQGIYWGKFAGRKGYKSTSLFSVNRVIEHLDPDTTRSEAYLVYLKDLLHFDLDDKANMKPVKGNWRRIHKLLISMVAAKNVDMRPTSYTTIEDQISLSRSTIYRSIKDCKQAKVMYNMAPVLKSNDSGYLDRKRKSIVAEGGKFLGLVKISPWQYALMDILPNSYQLLGFERLEMKKRPKILKHYDTQNAIEVSQKIYFVDEPKSLDKKLQYICRGETFIDNWKRPIVLWQGNGI